MPFKSEKQRRWMHKNEPEMAKRWEADTPESEKLPEKVEKKKSYRAEIVEEVQSDEVACIRPVNGIAKITVEQVLRMDIPDDATMPLWKNGKLTGSVIKKIWDLIDLDLIRRVENGWKIIPKTGYNKTTYWVSRTGKCSCQGHKVNGACSHALGVDVFVHLQKMGCAQ